MTYGPIEVPLYTYLRVLSPSMKISLPTEVVSISTQLVANLVVTPSRSSDGELKMVPHTGSAPTHGTKIGEITDSSRFSEDLIIAVLKLKLLLVSFE